MGARDRGLPRCRERERARPVARAWSRKGKRSAAGTVRRQSDDRWRPRDRARSALRESPGGAPGRRAGGGPRYEFLSLPLAELWAAVSPPTTGAGRLDSPEEARGD